MLKRLATYAGTLTVIAGLTVFAFAVTTQNAPAQEGTPTTTSGTTTAGGTGTTTTGTSVTGTRTPGALTPVSTPTSGTGGAGGAGSSPTTSAGGLPSTGTGYSVDGDGNVSMWIAGIGVLLAVMGAGTVLAGTQRRN